MSRRKKVAAYLVGNNADEGAVLVSLDALLSGHRTLLDNNDYPWLTPIAGGEILRAQEGWESSIEKSAFSVLGAEQNPRSVSFARLSLLALSSLGRLNFIVNEIIPLSLLFS
jgi:hypothetical protein